MHYSFLLTILYFILLRECVLKAQLKNLNQNVCKKNINEINGLIVSFGNDSVWVRVSKYIYTIYTQYTCDLIHVISKYWCNTHLYVIFVVYVCMVCAVAVATATISIGWLAGWLMSWKCENSNKYTRSVFPECLAAAFCQSACYHNGSTAHQRKQTGATIWHMIACVWVWKLISYRWVGSMQAKKKTINEGINKKNCVPEKIVQLF